MGEVYAGLDLELQQEVAIKVVRQGFAADPRWLAQLRREIRNARSVQHENICRMFDIHRAEAGENGPLTFLTMELLAGRTLAEEIRGNPLPLNVAVDVAAQIIAGLGAIHRAGIVHRDMKSANVMLTKGAPRRAVIMDFGLSRNLQATSFETSMIRTCQEERHFSPPWPLQGLRRHSDIDIRRHRRDLPCVVQ